MNARRLTDEQLTAYALDQLDGDERTEVETLLAQPGQDDASRTIAETQRLAASVRLAAADVSSPPATSADLRSAVLARLDSDPVDLVGTAPKLAHGRGVAWAEWLVLGGIAAVLVALFLPPQQSSRESARNSGEGQVELAAEQFVESDETTIVSSDSDEGQWVIDNSHSMDAYNNPLNPSIPGVAASDELTLTVEPPQTTYELSTKLQVEGTDLGTINAYGGKVVTEQRRELQAHYGWTKDPEELQQLESKHASRLSTLDLGNTWESRRQLQDSVAGEQYARIIENLFLSPRDQPLSTFSIDVDTASYANVRRFLTSGRLPPANAVRLEELVNYFTYDYPQPKGDQPFSVNMEVAECPWRDGHLLLRVGLKGKEIRKAERPASNLVFLLDVSGSMADENKLPLLKTAMSLLVGELTENDRVSIVTYAGDAGLRLPPTSGDQRQKIEDVIDSLSSGGSTNGSAGIELAYEQAAQSFIKGGTNRVILATDGDLNVGITDADALVNVIKTKATEGTFLTVLGFGEGNLQDAKLEKLADNGNGLYAYIDSVREARKVLVEQMTGSTITIAKDVKVQIEFNPAQVASYRLLGYENRVMAAQEFNDDKKDAGEIGAGHTVTALYELVPVGNEKDEAGEPRPATDPLKYQKSGDKKTEVAAKAPAPNKLTDAAKTGELLTLKLRYIQPKGDASKLLEFPLKDRGGRFNAASKDMQFAAAVASFGMCLRQSQHRGSGNLSAVAEIAGGAMGEDKNGYRAEFLDLVRKAQALGR